jgi:hypothetical protein
MKQKRVVILNIHTTPTGEFELEKINKYLYEGYDVGAVYQTVSNGANAYIDLTFILEKGEKKKVQQIT